MGIGGDFFSFVSSPAFMPTIRKSRPSTSGLNGAPGASVYRVTTSAGRSSECALTSGEGDPFLGVSRFKSIAEIQLQPITPEALTPQEPLDEGRTWASVLPTPSTTKTHNSVRRRMAFTSSPSLLPAKKCARRSTGQDSPALAQFLSAPIARLRVYRQIPIHSILRFRS